jgi:hypothetical protein
MAKKESLTPEERALIEVKRKEWLDFLFSCKVRTNREEFTKGAHWMYKLCNFEAPDVIFVESPLACQYAIPVLEVEYIRRDIRELTRKKIAEHLKGGKEITSKLRKTIKEDIMKNLSDEVKNAAKAA